MPESLENYCRRFVEGKKVNFRNINQVWDPIDGHSGKDTICVVKVLQFKGRQQCST
jgi:hypothetical protein